MEGDKAKMSRDKSNHFQSEHENAGEGLKKVGEAFNDWCATLSSYSIQLAYAVIAANWPSGI